MTICCNIWMICLILIWFFYGLSRMFQLPQFVWALRSSVWDVFINILLIDAIDRSKISSDQKRFFIALSLYPLSFFANTPFNFDISNLDIIWSNGILSLKYISTTTFGPFYFVSIFVWKWSMLSRIAYNIFLPRMNVINNVCDANTFEGIYLSTFIGKE